MSFDARSRENSIVKVVRFLISPCGVKLTTLILLLEQDIKKIDKARLVK
jgi:hypothetical protein